MKMIKKKCAYCDSTILKVPSSIKKCKRSFCNFICYGKWSSEEKRGKKHPLWRRTKVICKNCKKPIFRTYYKKKRNIKHFCSKECYYLYPRPVGEKALHWKGGKILIKCEYCKREFLRHKNKYTTTKRSFCSKECAIKGKQGKNSHMWKGGLSRFPYPFEFNKKLKEKIRKRDEYKCQLCYITEEEYLIIYGVFLSVHHIDYNKENCKEENLVTLCRQCNNRVNFNRKYWESYFVQHIIEQKIEKKYG